MMSTRFTLFDLCVSASALQSAPVTSLFELVVFDWESIPLSPRTCHSLCDFSTPWQQQWQLPTWVLCRFSSSLHRWTAIVCQRFFRFALECISKVSLLWFLLIRPKPILFSPSDLLSVFFRVYIWNIWKWSVLLDGWSHKSHWHRGASRLLWRSWRQSEVRVANYSHWFVPSDRKDSHTVREANPASQLTNNNTHCFSGLFKVVPEEMPYSSVEEMMIMRPVGLDSCLSFTFKSHTELMLEDFTVAAGNTFTVLYVDHQDGKEDRICCRFQGQQDTTALVYIPLSVCGEFTECESEEHFTLQQIISSPFLLNRRFCLVNTTMSERPLRLSPVYQVHAVMNRKQTFILILILSSQLSAANVNAGLFFTY